VTVNERWTGPLLAAIATALSFAFAVAVYQRWHESELRTVEDARQDHVVSFRDLKPGVPTEILSFPATERLDDIPRFTALLSDRHLRERPFDDLPPPGTHRIVAVGESSTFGTGLAIGERFTELLQVDLEARHPGCCEVLNAGRMGMTTPRAVEFVASEVLAWKPSVLIYDTMANDLRDPERDQRLDLRPERVVEYEAGLRALVDACSAAGTKVVFWANTIAIDSEQDPLLAHRAAMRRVARDSDQGFVDLDSLYTAHPATSAEMKAFLAEPNWTQWHPVLGPDKLPLTRVALHVDWVHPNRFGSRRLADGLLREVERALGLAP
jgi:hypothetical protein